MHNLDPVDVFMILIGVSVLILAFGQAIRWARQAPSVSSFQPMWADFMQRWDEISRSREEREAEIRAKYQEAVDNVRYKVTTTLDNGPTPPASTKETAEEKGAKCCVCQEPIDLSAMNNWQLKVVYVSPKSTEQYFAFIHTKCIGRQASLS